MATQLGFYVNLSACSGCKACQAACKDRSDLEVGRLWRRVIEVSGGEWEQRGSAWVDNTFTYYVTTACNHCQSPDCMEVCPTQAISKREDGIVLLDESKCIGCRYCEWVCPYGAPQFNELAGVMSKCDFCYDRIDAGLAPSCVAACQMRVLEFGDLEELRAKYGDTSTVFPLPDPSMTDPALVLKPHKDVARAATGGAEIANVEEI